MKDLKRRREDASTAAYKAFFKNKDAVNGRRGWRCRSREAIWCP